MNSVVVSEENVVNAINDLKKTNKIVAITIIYESIEEEVDKVIIEEEPDRPPKRHANAYIHFCSEKRKEIVNTNLKVVEVSKIIADMWKKLSDDEKKKYWSIAEQDKIRYLKELEAYQKLYPNYDPFRR